MARLSVHLAPSGHRPWPAYACGSDLVGISILSDAHPGLQMPRGVVSATHMARGIVGSAHVGRAVVRPTHVAWSIVGSAHVGRAVVRAPHVGGTVITPAPAA
jgi:hypothetical protein